MTEINRFWKTRHSDAEYGPYTDAEMLEFIGQCRIVRETEVQHPRLTQGLWMKAMAVGLLRDRMEKIVPPPIQKVHPVPPPDPRATETGTQSYRLQNVLANSLENKWVYPWILLAIWATWVSVGFLIFVRMVFDYEYIHDGMIYYDHWPRPISSWIASNAWSSFFISVPLALPAGIASIVTFFFFPRPPASR